LARRRVFVSCGQITPEEHWLGDKVLEVIRAHGMDGFFARDVHTAGGLNAEVFEALRTCDAFIAIMHRRGEVRFLDHVPCHRASTWVQQEIAILCYRIHAQARPIPIRVYSEFGIRLEGVMAAAIVNPIEFSQDDEVVASLDTWLGGAEFRVDPVASMRERLFAKQTTDLSSSAWTALDVLAAETVTPGDPLAYLRIEADLQSLGLGAVEPAIAELIRVGLVQKEINRLHRDQADLSIHPAFYDLVVRALRDRGDAG